ncbi:alpha/beta hydrolase [Salmonella enterica subsp. diarizonae]|uniref:alpha/beta fold hydrolase n=1 Tax=Salmonella enterica TaxID=28901 RepID=UPI00111C1F7E|nr:alpha/beta hydrolase [Salmonella enterica]EDM1757856.1 alpha/beta hydrolase [Salmonella enterica subsp. diarizonae]
MPYTTGNSKIFYQTTGDGPLVVLLHGLLMRGQTWVESGFVQVLSRNFRVVYPDLLGHGYSDKPSDIKEYEAEQQADIIAELIKSLGYGKAHIIGYSSGAWLATVIAQYYSNTVTSLVLGGWDIMDGLPEVSGRKLSFDMFMEFAMKTTPDLVLSVCSTSEKGLRCYFDILREHNLMDNFLKTLKIPLMFWAGKTDPYYNAMKKLAREFHAPFISGSGNHITEILNPDILSMEQINHFISSCCSE